jgi:hypothetical protein
MPPLPLQLPVNIYQIQVTFNPANIGNPDPEQNPLFTFQGDIVGTTITVQPGLAMIVFNLETDPPEPHATFQTSPLQWFGTDAEGNSTGTPAMTPGMFWVQLVHERAVTLVDFNVNTTPPGMNHWFNLVVAFNGQTYGSDPSIVNQPLGG